MTALFDHEKLDVYQLELQFIAWVTPLLEEVSAARGHIREVCDQLDRASLSALLNTAEGNGKRRRPVRAKFFDDARGSATERAACLDAIVVKRACAAVRVLEGKQMLLRIVSMLCGLVDRFDAPERLGEESIEYRIKAPQFESRNAESNESRRRTRTRRKRKHQD